MQIFAKVGQKKMQLIIPVLLALLVVSSVFSGSCVYDSFVNGAKKSLPVLFSILPFMAAMLCALNIFRDSGALALVTKLIAPLLNLCGIPSDLATLVILRPFSGSAAIALLNDVYLNSGVDSYSGYLASIMLGSTETIFYTVALYFGAINVKKTRHAVPTALISGIIGIAASIILAKLMY